MMLARWRKIVKPDDVVLHLGDLVAGDDDVYESFRTNVAPHLTGDKYIILGNHDKRKYDYYQDFGFKVIKPFSMTYRGYTVSFNHYPKFLNEADNAREFHVHGHIHDHSYSRNELTRWGNINVSVEMMDYRPQRITRVLNKAISRRNRIDN